MIFRNKRFEDFDGKQAYADNSIAFTITLKKINPFTVFFKQIYKMRENTELQGALFSLHLLIHSSFTPTARRQAHHAELEALLRNTTCEDQCKVHKNPQQRNTFQ